MTSPVCFPAGTADIFFRNGDGIRRKRRICRNFHDFDEEGFFRVTKAAQLRAMIQADGLIMAPGAYDAWSARLVENAGFDAVYMTGYGVSASVLGRPDIGLISFHEMVEMARNMAGVTTVPLIADADNGYGNSLNVVRTVREYENAGVAAIQLEDQVLPKRCGHMEGKQLVPGRDMIAKIKAAIYARQDPDTVLIARTDARAVNGIDDAVARAKSYAAAGADVIFVEAPQSAEEVRKIAESVHAPLLANMVEHGKTPLFAKEELLGMGYKIAIYPVTTLYAATKNVMDAMRILRDTGGVAGCSDCTTDFPTFNRMIGLQEMRDLEERFNE